MINIGFTGSRHGMSEHQKMAFRNYVCRMVALKRPVAFHHGDCVGADYEAHDIITEYDLDLKIIIHPPKDSRFRAYSSRLSTKTECEILPPDHYLSRDRAIVYQTKILIAAPESDTPVSGSGSWYTLNFAKEKKKHVIHLKR